MASRRSLGMMAVAAFGALSLQACIAVPVQRDYRHRASSPAYGYGGSGFRSEVNPREAQRECVRTARDFRNYRGVRVENVDVTSPETARVVMSARTYGGYTRLGCTYDARTGRAWVP